jgi:hypothetical protein
MTVDRWERRMRREERRERRRREVKHVMAGGVISRWPSGWEKSAAKVAAVTRLSAAATSFGVGAAFLLTGQPVAAAFAVAAMLVW